ncbi:helix-turn-helix domain-containing protein [Chachezhania sediminis]|uniref:helix-turn-helix domain-containing protein n=1 Tax=Chachezhania sediminis TaxID=2599291 RepID=UPI0018EF1958|nr:helix-turn-helix transcriptional regulator [Chachezhania sediminis]
MARVATGLGLRELAAQAEVSPNTISRLERGEELRASTIEIIQAVFERAGVVFLEDDGRGPGVRVRSL